VTNIKPDRFSKPVRFFFALTKKFNLNVLEYSLSVDSETKKQNRSHFLSISIDHFLAEFKQIAQEKCVIFWPRPENTSMMSILGLTRSIVTTDILLNLTKSDYCGGPLYEEGHPDAWCFGKTIKGYEIYIKLTIEEKKKRKNAICISFHESTKPLSYPSR